MLTSIRGLMAASAFVGLALAATPALAEEAIADDSNITVTSEESSADSGGSDETDPPSDFTITGNVALVTDYRFRGLSYSGGDVAVQGSIGISHSSGLYAGIWASSLEQDALDIYGSVETDFYAGWTGEIASGLTADVGITLYAYPNGSFGDADIWEPYASLTAAIGPATAKLGVNYAWNQDSLGGSDNFYIYTDLGVGIPNTPISLSGHLGYTDGVLSPNVLTLTSGDGGWDYALGATWNITKNLSIGAQYVGVDGTSLNGFSDDTVVGTLKLSF